MAIADDAFDFEGSWECKTESELALQVQEQRCGRFATKIVIWIPKSVIHDDSEVYKPGTSGKLVVKSWWAEENGYL